MTLLVKEQWEEPFPAEVVLTLELVQDLAEVEVANGAEAERRLGSVQVVDSADECFGPGFDPEAMGAILLLDHRTL